MRLFPLGQNASIFGIPQIRRHRGGLGMDIPPLFSVYTDYNTLRKKINTASHKNTNFFYEEHGLLKLCPFIGSPQEWKSK